MNIVFLVHYFPPLNSSGTRRILGFSKYLNAQGHNVSIISTVKTTKDGPLSEEIPTFCNLIEVSWLNRTSKLSDIKNSSAPSINTRSKSGQILLKIRKYLVNYCGQLFDHRVLFTLYFLRPRLPKRLKQTFVNADIIISSFPPWPVHLAGLICAWRFKKKWLADYRDQFSANHVFPSNKIAQKLELILEKYLTKKADAITVVSLPMLEYYLQFKKKSFCVETGFDDELLPTHSPQITEKNKYFIRFMGTTTPHNIPWIFLSALTKLPKNVLDTLIIEFYGDSALAQKTIPTNFPSLITNIKYLGMVPHKESIRLMHTADALLLKDSSSSLTSSAKSLVTNKLYEYIASCRPIIAEVDQTTLMGQMVLQSGLSCACTIKEKSMIHSILLWHSKQIKLTPNLEYIKTFSRKKKASEFEAIIMNIINQIS